MKTEKRHFPEADVLKGILILLVVLGHFLYPFRRSSALTRALFFGIYSFHMPAFVFLSGLLAGNRIQKTKGVRWEKVKKFLCYYALYKVILYPVEYLVYGPSPFRLLTESGAPWYLLSLAFWYCLIPIFAATCRHFPAKTGKCILAGASVLVGLAVGYLSFSEYFLCWQRTVAFLPFFTLGWCLGAEQMFGAEGIILRIQGKGQQLLIGASLLLIFAFMLCALYVPDGIMHVFYGMNYEVLRRDLPASCFLPCAFLLRLLWYGAAMLITVGLCVLVSDFARRCVNVQPRRLQKLLAFCGHHSLAIYILHRPLRDLWMYFFL